MREKIMYDWHEKLMGMIKITTTKRLHKRKKEYHWALVKISIICSNKELWAQRRKELPSLRDVWEFFMEDKPLKAGFEKEVEFR